MGSVRKRDTVQSVTGNELILSVTSKAIKFITRGLHSLPPQGTLGQWSFNPQENVNYATLDLHFGMQYMYNVLLHIQTP